MRHKDILWHDRKRNFLGLPWTFTIYELSANRLFIQRGIFNLREDEVRLYRITNLTLTRSFWQRIIRTGTLHLDSTDQGMGNFDLTNIKRPDDIKEQLSNLIEIQRKENHVYARENMGAVDIDHEHDNDDFVDFNHDGINDLDEVDGNVDPGDNNH